MRIRAGLGLLAVLALPAGSCSAGREVAVETIGRFLAAVQAEEPDGLYCLIAGAAEAGAADEAARRAEFAEWTRQRYEDYYEGRDRGRVELDEHGVVLVKLLALGRGTFFDHGPVRRIDTDVLVVETDLRFGYAHIDLSRFSPGTIFYVAGAPVGRVHAVRVPDGAGEVTLDLLDSARVGWTLVRTGPAGDCPGGWAVASAEAVAGSERTVEVTWEF